MKLAPYSIAVVILLFILAAGVGRAVAQAPFQSSGYVQGYVYGLNADNELIPLVWASVTASNSNYRFVASTGTMGGFDIFLPPGSYNLSISSPGFKTYNGALAVSEGSASSITVYLYESGIPIPEFPVQIASIVMIISLAAAVLLTKRATKRKR
jgi:hypothetical protein